MAKELPYFKFEPNKWENGNIQILSREDKGLFIDLCSMYWSRLGDVPIKLAIQKLCGGNATTLNPLCDEKIIEVLDGNIFIKFLSEQLNEFEDTSKQNSKNAKEGWEKRRKSKENQQVNATAYATALNPQSETYAIREEKIREDNVLLEKVPKQSSNNNITLKDKKSENFQKIEVVENSPYGDGELHFKCRKYEKENPGKYSVELYKEFLTYWTAKTQKGRSNGSELWRTRETFVLSLRLDTWAKNNEKSNNSIKSNGRESKEDYLKRVGGELDDIFKRKEQTGNYFGIVIPREPEPANDDSRYTAFVDVGNGK
jgi:hypothetical protein